MSTTAGRCIVVAEEMLFAYSVYVFVFRFLPGVEFASYSISQIVLATTYIVLFILCHISFWRASNSNPGYISDKFIQGLKEKGDNYFESIATERKHDGGTRKCNKCKKFKPDRAHHCSICKRCVLKMDHHCPFINNCIGFFNYKYFFIFLFWTVCFCCFIIGCMSYAEYHNHYHHHKFDYFELSAAFLSFLVLFFLSILFGNHIRFICFNMTTIEHVEKKAGAKGHPYNLGARKNFVEIFGSNPFLWFLPIWTSKGDGVTYKVQNENCLLLLRT